MASLEQIIRPFVVDPTTPPVPYITTNNDPAPDLVRLSIGIGGTDLNNLSPAVAPKVPPNPSTVNLSPKPSIASGGGDGGSSYSISVTWYHDETVKEETDQQQG